MAAYRIKELGSRIVVSTEREALLICKSIAVAERVVADAELLETVPAKLIFSRKPAAAEDE